MIKSDWTSYQRSLVRVLCKQDLACVHHWPCGSCAMTAELRHHTLHADLFSLPPPLSDGGPAVIESFICNGAEVAAGAAKCRSGGGQIKSSNHLNQQRFAALRLLSGVRGDKGVTADSPSSPSDPLPVLPVKIQPRATIEQNCLDVVGASC